MVLEEAVRWWMESYRPYHLFFLVKLPVGSRNKDCHQKDFRRNFVWLRWTSLDFLCQIYRFIMVEYILHHFHHFVHLLFLPLKVYKRDLGFLSASLLFLFLRIQEILVFNLWHKLIYFFKCYKVCHHQCLFPNHSRHFLMESTFFLNL